jgi:hypothetical protein
LLWGALHGALVVIHRMWRRSSLRAGFARQSASLVALAKAAAVCMTFHCICVGWCFFRLTDLGQSLACLRQCVVFDSDRALIVPGGDAGLLLLLGSYGCAWLLGRRSVDLALALNAQNGAGAPSFARGFAWGLSLSLLVLAVLLAPSGYRPPFIYFQF